MGLRLRLRRRLDVVEAGLEAREAPRLPVLSSLLARLVTVHVAAAVVAADCGL